MSKRVAWSFSRLNNYESCPKKFYHLAVAKDVREGESEQIRYGKMVHKALEDRVSKGKRLPLNLVHLEKYAARLAGATGEKLTEQQLAIDDKFQPCDWFSRTTWCRAIIDLAIINGDTGVVIDYKTGKIKDDFMQLRLAGALLMLHKPELHKVELCYLWTKEKALTKDESVMTRDDIKTVVTTLMPRVKAYELAHHEQNFPAKPGFLCKKYCPVIRCPHNGE